MTEKGKIRNRKILKFVNRCVSSFDIGISDLPRISVFGFRNCIGLSMQAFSRKGAVDAKKTPLSSQDTQNKVRKER